MRGAILRFPFLLSTTAVVAVCALVVRSQAFARNPEVAAWGVTFDLTITIPLFYWFFIVRTGKARPMTLAPLFVLCTIAAAGIVPRGHQQFLRDLGRIAVPLAELALVAAIVHRIRSARGENAIRAVLAAAEPPRSEVLKVAILDEPRWLITLREPVVAKGLAGLRKEIRALALLPDEDEAIDALRRVV